MGARTPGESAGSVLMSVSAVFISSDLISAGERSWWAWINNAALPATIGVDPDVPPNAVTRLPVPASAETEAPGALMSGLMALKLKLGPRAELLTTLPTNGTKTVGETAPLTVAPAESCPLNLVASARVITSVSTKVSPPPKANEIGSPPVTNPMSTPIAPALAARSTFRLALHPPRSINAILPEGLARYVSAGLPSETASAGQPRPTNTMSPVNPVTTGA